MNGVQLTSWQALRAGIISTTKAMLKWLVANPAGWAIIATASIAALVKIVDELGVTVEEQRESLENLKQEYSEITSELQACNEELKTTEQRMRELEKIESPTFAEKEEYDNLVKTNNELQRKIDLLELEEKIKSQEAREAFVSTMKKDTDRTKDDSDEYFYYIDPNDPYQQKSLGKGSTVTYSMGGFSIQAVPEDELIDVYENYASRLKELDEQYANDLENETYKETKATIEQEMADLAKYLADKSNQWSSDANGIKYIQNPTTEDDKAVNEWLDYIADFQDRMTIAMGGDNAKTNTFNRVVDNWQFDDTVQDLQDLGKQGQVTAEMLNDPKYDEFINKLVFLGVIDSADNLEDVALAFNSVADSAENAADSASKYGNEIDVSFAEAFNAKDFEESAKTLKELAISGELSPKTFTTTKAYIQLLEQTGLTAEEAIEKIRGIAIAESSLSDIMNSMRSNVELMNDVTNELSENGKISFDTLQNIASNYPSLERYVTDYLNGVEGAGEELINALQEQYNNDLDNYREYYVLKQQNDETWYYNYITNTANWVVDLASQYGIDLKNYANYLSAKEALEEEIANKNKILETNKSIKNEYSTSSTYDSILNKNNHIPGLNSLSSKKLNDWVVNNADKIIKSTEQEVTDLTSILNNIVEEFNKGIPNVNDLLEEYKSSDYVGGSNSNSKDSTSTFDWIETTLDRAEESIDKFDKKLSNTYSKWEDREQALQDVIAETTKARDLQEQAYDKYMAKADSVNLPPEIKRLVREGDMWIQDNVNSDTKELIDEYSEWYNKAQEAEKAQAELNQTLAELNASTTVDMIEDYYDAIDEAHNNTIEELQNKIDMAETQGFFANESYYNDVINELVIQKADLEKKKADLNRVLDGSELDKDSQAYKELQNLIGSISNEIQELGTEIEDTKNSAQENEWNYFDYLRESVSRLIDEADYFIELMSNEDMFDDQGNLTKYADATMALHGSNYEVYMANAKEYAKEMKELESQLANGTDVRDRYNEVVDAHQDAILAAQDEKRAILDLVEEGYQKQLDALQEIIDKKKEALSTEKDLYDYQKSIQEKSDKVSSLRKQLEVYQNDTSEEGLAQAQKLSVELQKAEDDLQQTEYEKMISDQQQMLDKLSTDYELWMNQRMDNEDELLRQIQEKLSGNGEIATTLKEISTKYGTSMSQSLTDALTSANPFESVVTAITDLVAKITGLYDGNGGSNDNGGNNNSDNSNNGGSSGGNTTTNGTTNTKEPTNITTEPTKPSERYMFIDKDSSYPKELLEKTKEYSIVDRLKYHRKDSSWDARAKYYSDLGGSGAYTGSASQNAWLINKMKENGFAQGGTIGNLIKRSGEDGFVLARTGEEIFSLEKIKALEGAFQRIEPLLSNSNLIKLPNIPTRNIGTSASVDVGGIQVVLPSVTNYTEFRNALLNDKTFENAMNSAIGNKMMGGNSLSKFKHI